MRDLNADNQATFFYLVLLLIIVGGSMALGSRKQLNKTLQQFGIWALIFIGFIGAYSMKDQIEDQLFPSRPQIVSNNSVSINRAWDGHFYVDLLVNSRTIKFVIDTGATNIVLRQADATRIGIDLDSLDFSQQASTANGIVAIANVQLKSVNLGQFRDFNLRASVNGGDLDTSLLGMTYLDRFSKIEITKNQMQLFRE